MIGDSFLERQIRRVARNWMLASAVFIALAALFGWLNWRYLYNFFKGPFRIDEATLLSIQDPDRPLRYYVTLPAEKIFSIGIDEEITGSFGRRKRFHLLAVQVGNRFLLVKSPVGESPKAFTGALTQIRDDERAAVSSHLNPKVQQRFLPFLLDAAPFRSDAYWQLGVGAFLLLACLWGVITALRWSVHPESHPLWRALAKYGPAREVGMKIDAEMRGEGGGEIIGPAHLTTTWLVFSSAFKIGALRLADIVWAYQKVVKHYHGFIPVRKTYEAMAFDRNGSSLEISAKEEAVAGILKALQRRVPGLVLGFNKELEQLWKTRRSEFILAVDSKRGQVSADSVQQKKLVHV